MNDAIIQAIHPLDIPKIFELEQKCFTKETAYSSRQLQYLITQARSICFVCKTNEHIQGYIIVLYRKDSMVAGIETIGVDPLFRGQGIARSLLLYAESEMAPRGIRRIRLEVSVGNKSAISLYEKSGFRITSLLKNYYKYHHFGSSDAYRMVKELTT
ncbi:MAG: N-acetyltransferase [Thermoplasmatota archaeon]